MPVSVLMHPVSVGPNSLTTGIYDHGISFIDNLSPKSCRANPIISVRNRDVVVKPGGGDDLTNISVSIIGHIFGLCLVIGAATYQQHICVIHLSGCVIGIGFSVTGNSYRVAVNIVITGAGIVAAR